MKNTQFKTEQLGVILNDIADRSAKIELLATMRVDRLSDVANADALCCAVIDAAQRIGWLTLRLAKHLASVLAWAMQSNGCCQCVFIVLARPLACTR